MSGGRVVTLTLGSGSRAQRCGNEVGVVIVATQAGTPGTGTIVADLC